MGNPLILLIILIFIFRGLSKLAERARKEEEEKKEPHPQEWKRYFEKIGIPPAEEKEEILLPVLSVKAKKTKIKPVPSKREIKKEGAILKSPPLKIPTLSLDKVREGIILSEILGPPRAKNKPVLFLNRKK